MAETHGVSLRTVRRWRAEDPGERRASPGRPPAPQCELEEARRLVEAELELQGWGAGEEPLWRALQGRVPRARVRRVLRELKQAKRRRRRRHAEESRVSVEVQCRDTVWAIDATHLGRDALGRAVQAEVVREVASTRTIGLSVGPAATGEEVVALLDQVSRERGGEPLVLQRDNGGAYCSPAVLDWCRTRGVVVLANRPHTPQHNGAVEHGMRELKGDAGLGKGRLVESTDTARARLEASRARLDGHRLRRTRGWKTAVEADSQVPHWTAVTSREGFIRRVACEIAQGLLECTGRAARRRAVRGGIQLALEELSLITRTRGGRPVTAHDADNES